MACRKISFCMLAEAACVPGISAVFGTGLRKHGSKASFLYEILHSMLSSFLKESDISAYGKIKNVLPVDASVIRQGGKKQFRKIERKGYENIILDRNLILKRAGKR